MQRNIGFLLGGLVCGYALGYAVCWWRRPLPQLVSADGRSVTQNPARIILQTGEAITRVTPVLQPIAGGRIPSPSDIFKIVKGVN